MQWVLISPMTSVCVKQILRKSEKCQIHSTRLSNNDIIFYRWSKKLMFNPISTGFKVPGRHQIANYANYSLKHLAQVKLIQAWTPVLIGLKWVTIVELQELNVVVHNRIKMQRIVTSSSSCLIHLFPPWPITTTPTTQRGDILNY